MIFSRAIYNKVCRHAKWWIAAGIFAVLALLYVFNPTHAGLAPKCMFKLLTGYSCPGCGIQRATHAFLHGHWAEAWAYNRFLALSLPYMASLIVTEYFTQGERRQRWRNVVESPQALWAYVVLSLVWGVVRNVLGI